MNEEVQFLFSGAQREDNIRVSCRVKLPRRAAVYTYRVRYIHTYEDYLYNINIRARANLLFYLHHHQLPGLTSFRPSPAPFEFPALENSDGLFFCVHHIHIHRYP